MHDHHHFNHSVPEAELIEKPPSFIFLTTSLGTLVGYEKKTIDQFYGIPYAEVPVGELRFQKPKIIKKYPQEPYRAFYLKPACPQLRSKKYNPNDTFNEDCLYMNIFTPSLNPKIIDGKCREKYPVMIYIYESLDKMNRMSPFRDEQGYGHLLYPGDLFAALHNTILVVFNYRQPLVSSLYVENNLPGNLGLFDQNLVIQWVKKHIGDLCGDDQLITLFGHDAVGLHLISSYSKEMIKNAIIQSSSVLFMDQTPLTKNEIMLSSFAAIEKLGCLNMSDSIMIDHMDELEEKVIKKYFEHLDGEEIFKKEYFKSQLQKNLFDFESRLGEKDENLTKDNYIDKDLLKLVKFLSNFTVNLECLQSVPIQRLVDLGNYFNQPGWSYYYDFDFIDYRTIYDYKLFDKLNLNPNLNLLIGVTSDEACLQKLLHNEDRFTDQFKAPTFSKDETKEKIKKLNFLKTDSPGFADRMADFYTNERQWMLLITSTSYYEALSNIYAAKNYFCPVHFYSNYASMTANSVQSYTITYEPTKHIDYNLFPYDRDTFYWLGKLGPCHSDELIYLFNLPHRTPNQFTDLDRKFSLKLLLLWTTFARDGRLSNLHPSNEEWPSSNKQNPQPRYVEINEHFTRERKFEFENRCMRWWKPYLEIYKR